MNLQDEVDGFTLAIKRSEEDVSKAEEPEDPGDGMGAGGERGKGRRLNIMMLGRRDTGDVPATSTLPEHRFQCYGSMEVCSFVLLLVSANPSFLNWSTSAL